MSAWSRKSIPASRAAPTRARISASDFWAMRISPSTTLGAVMSVCGRVECFMATDYAARPAHRREIADRKSVVVGKEGRCGGEGRRERGDGDARTRVHQVKIR